MNDKSFVKRNRNSKYTTHYTYWDSLMSKRSQTKSLLLFPGFSIRKKRKNYLDYGIVWNYYGRIKYKFFLFDFAKMETIENHTVLNSTTCIWSKAIKNLAWNIWTNFILTVPLPGSESGECQGGTLQIINIVFVCKHFRWLFQFFKTIVVCLH